jgi:hypothetical protein
MVIMIMRQCTATFAMTGSAVDFFNATRLLLFIFILGLVFNRLTKKITMVSDCFVCCSSTSTSIHVFHLGE